MGTVTGAAIPRAAGGQGEALAGRWTEEVRRFVGDDAGRSVLLSGGTTTVAAGADVERPGASVLKVFVAVAAHLRAAAGLVDLDARIAVSDLPTSCNPSLLDSFEPGHLLTTAELARLSLATSDNRIAEHLVTLVGIDAVTAAATSLGCTGTALHIGFGDDALNARGRANVTTVADCRRVLDAVGRMPVLAPLRPALRTSLFNTRILSSLPDHVVVSHKTGTLDGVVADVGVIHAPAGDLTACFLTDGQEDPPATAAAIGRCARAAFDAWEALAR
ncbi:MAG: serine hydrolase [Acidimicrobiia bacterium]